MLKREREKVAFLEFELFQDFKELSHGCFLRDIGVGLRAETWGCQGCAVRAISLATRAVVGYTAASTGMERWPSGRRRTPAKRV